MTRHHSRRSPRVDTRVSGLFIQLLTTEWTKDSRGGAGARVRDATPLASVLPEALSGAGGNASFQLHHVYFSEQRRFLPRDWTEVRRGRPFVEVEAFRVERTDEGGVRVLLDYGKMGMPGRLEWSGLSRGEPQEELFHVAPGEWARGVYNERLQYWETGHSGYCKHVLNVGLLFDAELDVFLRTAPETEVRREFQLRQRGPSAPGAAVPRMPSVARH
ncbi:hypothetical protein ATI61_106576 [Archangium gephyra]|uniref:Uncharacterized protein n=1 Tax=Archangium gephyra TaxID=48 RepID=A0ABX9K129_9BACT|nr:hypothetical protein ATI61_106576 [Archangium gephyra]